jgi:hypothetical protein
MRPSGPTFWLLDGRVGWQTAFADHVAVDGRIRLAADPAGPLALGATGGTLGDLVLPQVLALSEEGDLYLLLPGELAVARFEPERHAFEPVETVGGARDDARGFVAPQAIAVAGGSL